jgi:nitrogen fixation/metabolism regulation signal transduction histidine kinase
VSLRNRLLLAFLAFALVPIAALTLFTLDQLERSAARWFRPGVENALESGLEATRAGLARMEGLALSRAEDWAGRWPARALDDRARAALRAEVRASGLDFIHLYRFERGGWTALERIAASGALGRAQGDLATELPAPGGPARVVRSAGGALAAFAPLDSTRAVVAGLWLPPEYFDQVRAAGEGVGRYRQLGLLVPLQQRWVWLLVVSLVVALAAAAATLASRLATGMSRPLAELSAAFERVAGGDLAVRVAPGGAPEMRSLAESFNRMTVGLAEARSSLMRAEREAVWREVARHLAHEIRNPLTPMRLSLHRLEKRLDSMPESERPAVRASLAALVQEIDHLANLAEQFAHYARLPEPRMEATDLVAVARSAVALHEPGRVTLAAPSGVAVTGDALLLSRAVHNLVLNALEAGAPDSPVEVAVRAEGDRAVLEVLDRGPGLAPEVRGKLFEPYVSTKRRGSGLGLSLVRDIAGRHGGEVTLEDREGGGARARLTLPRATEGGREAVSG